ncbi:hypothetical protein JCM11641_003900 [Rhodosporidiobolus odoratus]
MTHLDVTSATTFLQLALAIQDRSLHLLGKESVDAMVMTASSFDKLSNDQVEQLPLLPLVIARCAPHIKVRMLEALHCRKASVAMSNIMQVLVLLVGLAFQDEDNLSVFPSAPVEILWIIMITSSFPAS